MNFEAVVGNPPYQESDGGAQASSKPIYNHFVDIAKKTKATYISMITPTRWFAGGKGLDTFRNDMLNDNHLETLHDYLNPNELFSDINIRGGVCYFLRNTTYDNTESLISVYTHENSQKINLVKRSMKIDGLEIFIRDGRAISILNKIEVQQNNIIADYISCRKPFGLEGHFAKTENYKSTPDNLKHPIVCYGKGKKVGYIERNIISTHCEWIDKWKVYTPRANNIGTELNDDNLNTFIGAPKTICTESYLTVGAELDLDEKACFNLAKYFKTKFARFLHSLAKASQDATSKTFKFVPLQDFTENSDIDWSLSISETDKQLYAKYGLTEEEISFIEKTIKPMK